MMRRIFCATAIILLSAASVPAQTIRFDTNVGTFDMELNPTGNPFLQGHVDNMIAYVEAGRYDLTIINRAPDNFVIQMGGFKAPTLTLPSTARGTVSSFTNTFPSIASFGNVIVDENNDGVVDFDTTSLSNTRATVTLALSGQPNSGSSSFFVNMKDNASLLDPQDFVPFATIKNLETLALIAALPDVNLNPSNIPEDDQQGRSNLTVQDIPILENDRIVFIERAFMVNTSEATIASALANATIDDLSPAVASLVSDDDPPLNDPGGLLIVPTVPEPSSVILASMMAMLSLLKRRGRI